MGLAHNYCYRSLYQLLPPGDETGNQGTTRAKAHKVYDGARIPSLSTATGRRDPYRGSIPRARRRRTMALDRRGGGLYIAGVGQRSGAGCRLADTGIPDNGGAVAPFLGMRWKTTSRGRMTTTISRSLAPLRRVLPSMHQNEWPTARCEGSWTQAMPQGDSS